MGVETVICPIDGHIHGVTPFDDLETAVGHVRGVDGNEDREVLDILHMRVCGAVDVRRESSRTSELVVYFLILQSAKYSFSQKKIAYSKARRSLTLLFEQKHILPCQLTQDAK